MLCGETLLLLCSDVVNVTGAGYSLNMNIDCRLPCCMSLMAVTELDGPNISVKRPNLFLNFRDEK